MLRKIFFCSLLLICFMSETVFGQNHDPSAAAGGRSPLGTGLDGLSYWSTELPFVDVFKTSGPWFSGTADIFEDGRPLDLDQHGWVRSLKPGQIAKTLMLWTIQPHFPAGRYVVQYEGEGTLDYYFEHQGVRVEKSPGRDVIEIDAPPGGGIGLFITSVNPSNYIRNIRVLMPVNAPPGEIFNPLFLERLKGYNAIRFLSWMFGQNASDTANTPNRWNNRPVQEDARWSGTRGAPVEVMVALANRVKANSWFNIPHLADDDYVRHFAEAVRDSLDPELKVYIEYSNEVWNGIYPQYEYSQKKGLELGLGTSPEEAGYRYHTRRSREIFAIFEQVFGGRGRLVRVLATHSERPGITEVYFKNGDIMPKDLDAIAIGPYFGYELGIPENSDRVRKMKLDDLFQELESTTIPETLSYVTQHVEIAHNYGLPVIAYEGGQHLVDASPLGGGEAQKNSEHMNSLFDAANRDPRMGRLYSSYLKSWSEITGGQLFVHLMNCGNFGSGRWGTLEYLDQPRAEAPKHDALMRWIEGESGNT